MMMSLHRRKSSDVGASPRDGPRPSICKHLTADGTAQMQVQHTKSDSDVRGESAARARSL
jgi:hypothetical protein